MKEVLFLFVVLIVVFADENTNSTQLQSSKCEVWLTACHQNVVDLKVVRERISESQKNLETEQFKLYIEKLELNKSITELTFEVNNPGLPVPRIPISISGPSKWSNPSDALFLLPEPSCDKSLASCEEKTLEVAGSIISHQNEIFYLRTSITNITEENAGLKITENTLKQQLLNLQRSK